MKTLVFANGDKMPILLLGTWKAAPGFVRAPDAPVLLEDPLIHSGFAGGQ